MKDKKRVLTILLILIIFVAMILLNVNLFGGKKAKEVRDFQAKVETAACDLAKKEGYTKSLCDNFSYLCNINFEKLINNEMIDGDLINPLTGNKIKEDNKGFVNITWNENKEMICKYKED